MGRVKLEIKKIENSANRHATFTKRKTGLVKKAHELTILCGVDIALIMFSPVDSLVQYPTDSRINEIIQRYANVPPAERSKRKKENLEQLNRAIRKLRGEHEVSSSRMGIGGINNGDSIEYEKELCRLRDESEFFQSRYRLYHGDGAALDELGYERLQHMEHQVQLVIDKIRCYKQILEYNNSAQLNEGVAPGFGWLQRDPADMSRLYKDDQALEVFHVGDQGPFPVNPVMPEFTAPPVLTGFMPQGMIQQQQEPLFDCNEQHDPSYDVKPTFPFVNFEYDELTAESSQ